MRFTKSELHRNQFLNTLFYLICPPYWINLIQPWISIILILDYIIKIKASTTIQLPTVNIDYILTKLSINSPISKLIFNFYKNRCIWSFFKFTNKRAFTFVRMLFNVKWVFVKSTYCMPSTNTVLALFYNFNVKHSLTKPVKWRWEEGTRSKWCLTRRENQMHFESKPCTNVKYLFVIVSLTSINSCENPFT